MTAFLTAIQLLCTSIGFLVLFLVFGTLLLLSWVVIGAWLNFRSIARQEENKFRAELRTMYNTLDQADFDRVYRRFWEETEKRKSAEKN